MHLKKGNAYAEDTGAGTPDAQQRPVTKAIDHSYGG